MLLALLTQQAITKRALQACKLCWVASLPSCHNDEYNTPIAWPKNLTNVYAINHSALGKRRCMHIVITSGYGQGQSCYTEFAAEDVA